MCVTRSRWTLWHGLWWLWRWSLHGRHQLHWLNPWRRGCQGCSVHLQSVSTRLWRQRWSMCRYVSFNCYVEFIYFFPFLLKEFLQLLLLCRFYLISKSQGWLDLASSLTSFKLALVCCLLDVNECHKGNHNCSQRCINKEPGFVNVQPGFVCDCILGYRLASDGKNCTGNNLCVFSKCIYNTTVF